MLQKLELQELLEEIFTTRCGLAISMGEDMVDQWISSHLG